MSGTQPRPTRASYRGKVPELIETGEAVADLTQRDPTDQQLDARAHLAPLH